MSNISDNILSYFIKDIKDATERAFYKQVNDTNDIKIFYKDKIIYRIYYSFCFNYIYNIVKLSSIKYIRKSNICYNYATNNKALYYKNDAKIKINNLNNITFDFTYIYNKYLIKIVFRYTINNNKLLFVSIKNYNQYIYISFNDKKSIKYSKNLILIPNKYELSYYCKFFNLYFDN
jgi:hypothetical protein